MNIKKYALCSAVAVFAFGYGCLVQGGYKFLEAKWTAAPTSQVIEPALAIAAASCPEENLYSVPMGEALPSIEDNTIPPDLILTGAYFLDDTTLSKDFSDFESIELETHIYDPEIESEDRWTPIPPRGIFHAKRGYKLTSLMVGPTEIAFETVAIDGISYRFVGKIRQSVIEDETSEGDIVGKLTKLRNGKAIAFLNASFWVGGC